jgi:hypothetical protein
VRQASNLVEWSALSLSLSSFSLLSQSAYWVRGLGEKNQNEKQTLQSHFGSSCSKFGGFMTEYLKIHPCVSSSWSAPHAHLRLVLQLQPAHADLVSYCGIFFSRVRRMSCAPRARPESAPFLNCVYVCLCGSVCACLRKHART